MLGLSVDLFWTVPVSVFAAGILSSPHCAVMCGPLAFSFARSKQTLLAYNIGRMISYVSAGAVFGFAGKHLLGSFSQPVVSYIAILLLALMLLGLGYRTWKNQPLHITLPPFINGVSMRLFRLLRLRHGPQVLTAAFAGGTTILLPCGHLYGFLLGSAATGSAVGGAIFMFAFWLSTVPALTITSLLANPILKIKSAPKVAGVIFVIAGFISLASFASRIQSAHYAQKAEQTSSGHSCH